MKTKAQASPSRKYFKIMSEYDVKDEDITLPSLQLNSYHTIKADIIGKSKYVYIDINEDSGYKLMEEYDYSDDEKESEQIGQAMVSNLQHLSRPNLNHINHLMKSKELMGKHQRVRSMVNDGIKRSKDIINRARTIRVNKDELYGKKHQNRTHIYKRMDQGLLDKLKAQSQFDEADKLVKKRQKRLLQAYQNASVPRPKEKTGKTTSAMSKYLPILLPSLKKEDSCIKTNRLSFL